MARFVITDPSDQTQIFEISSPTISVGRVDSNDLVLRHPSVSRHHVRITVLPGGITLLHDLGSMNGTFVNNVQIQEHRLKDQDRIAIGMYELKYETTRAGDFHIQAGSGTVTDVSGLVGTDDISTALRLNPPTAPIAPVPMEDRVKVLEKENNLLKLLLAVGKTLSSVLLPDEIMHRVMELVFQMDNVERGFVMLHDEKKGFRPAVLLYKDAAQKADARGVALSTMVTEKLLNDRVPLLIYDVGTDERFSGSQSLRMSGIRSAMCAPLIYKDHVFGIFYVDCLSRPYAFTQEELGIFSVIAAEAAISFDNARSHEELARRVVERQALERFLSSNIVEKILANPSEIHLGGENQTVTILFSDIRGFTRMSEHMEPHAVVELLNEYFSEMTDIIFDSGGTLDKYLGDGIMAVYGAPIPKPDDALRATRTAMEMQRALAALNRDWESRGQQPLRIGVGVNTGPVTAGNIGSSKRMDYTVIGDAVNLASRLCANAPGGQILVSESTYLQLDGSIPAQRLEPIRVKGKEEPVELYEVSWQDSVP
ncbi:MAG TPA: adenylate/guanylate cyclase domain-containing protein [Terriglobia bacterium]|nr:adenylate/guanylate cyclase domain-containing protein [Terriglobia bacterium]